MTAPSLLPPPYPRPISPLYPDSDGRPIADNTLQFAWIDLIWDNLDAIFGDRDDVFVAGDLLWYPVEGEPLIRLAPDVLVAFGRPQGHRGSYRQWEEGGIPLHVVFEVLSPGNTQTEMIDKFHFYDEYGVEEYYVIDPDRNTVQGYTRGQVTLRAVEKMDGFVSPRLGVRFEARPGQLRLFGPDGRLFVPFRAERKQRVQAERESAGARRESQEARREAEEALRESQKARRETEEALRREEETRRLAEEALQREVKIRRQAEEAHLREEGVRREAEEARRESQEARRESQEARRQAEEALRREEAARREAEESRLQAQRLAEKLRALGIDPDA